LRKEKMRMSEVLNVDNLNTKKELNLTLGILSVLCHEAEHNDGNRFFGNLRKPSKLSLGLKDDYDRVWDKLCSLYVA